MLIIRTFIVLTTKEPKNDCCCEREKIKKMLAEGGRSGECGVFI
jgi:redox-regulated HSP33 family molecular chaperone